MNKIQTDNPIPDFFTIFQRLVHLTCIIMVFVITLHLQASVDAALSCSPGRPVTRGGCGKILHQTITNGGGRRGQ